MRLTERTKEAERNVSKGGVGNDSFGCTDGTNVHVRCKIIEAKNSKALSSFLERCVLMSLPRLPFAYHCTSDISKTRPELTKKRQIEAE